MVAPLGQRIADSGATVSVADLPVVRGDADLLGQLFQNLLSDALRFARGRPVDRHRRDAGGHPLALRVADNGIGVAPG